MRSRVGPGRAQVGGLILNEYGPIPVATPISSLAWSKAKSWFQSTHTAQTSVDRGSPFDTDSVCASP